MTPRSAALMLATLGVITTRAQGVITLDASYDHASLKSYTLTTNSRGQVLGVDLVGRSNYFNNNQWRWMNFTANGVAAQQLTFTVNQAFAGGNDALNTHAMVYSTDNGANWSFFDNNARSGNLYTFSNNTAFTSNSVQIAYAIPYSYGKSVSHAQSVIASQWGTPTLSGNASGVIGQSPGGKDDSVVPRTIAPRDIYAYRVTNTAYDAPGHIAKKKVVITTGLHAGETLGTHTYQGLVDFLISDDKRAAVLRNTADFYGYGMLNPDGRFAGNNRATIAQPNTEPNTGQWSPSVWNASPNRKDIKVNGDAMIKDITQTNTTVAAFIDFHSTIPSFPGEDFGYIEYEQGDNLAPWWVKFKQLAGTVVDDDSTGTGPSTANFGDTVLHAEVDVTFETQFGRKRNVDYYHNLGKTLGIAFFETYKPKAGDATFDGIVNFDDLTPLAQNYNQPVSIGWEQGDFNLDGIVNFDDLVPLAQNYTGSSSPNFATNVSASFAADWALAQSLVPEPTTLSLLAISSCLLARRR